MAKNCRFAVAIHISTLLALSEGKPATSEWIASSVNTNPVVVRRILSALAKAGLVLSTRGTNGGSTLARPPADISLLSINRAVDEEEPPALHHQQPNQACRVGREIQPILTQIMGKAAAASDAILAETTLADVVTAISAEG